MPRVPFETAVRHIRSLTAPAPDGLADRDLLSRFRKTRDESAFAALVARHGPAVLGVCRRVLSDRHAAEDAFQATFLVLARRAAAIRKSASVGCWLHGVAFRVATRLKGRLARQPRTGTVPDVAADSRDDVTWRDIRRVLDEEVNRLPERLRLPILLCYFEGKTRDEAAEALGWKVSTLRGRLEDGRLRLRARLSRRGVELSAALLAASAATDGAAVDETLLATTIRAATGSASAGVQSLANGVAMSALVTKGAWTSAALLLAVGLGTTLLAFRGQAGEAPGPAPKAADVPPKAAEPPPTPKADPWGDPAGGVKTRLRIAKTRLKSGEPLAFELDLRNERSQSFTTDASPFACEALVDGEAFTHQGDVDRKANRKELKTGEERVPFVSGTVDGDWKAVRRPALRVDESEPAIQMIPFRLSPGKHKVQVAFALGDTKARPVSNPVEIEVEAAPLDPAVRATALGADRIWVVPAPTRDKPVPAAEQVLKGPRAPEPESLFDLRLLPGDDPKQKWIVFLRAEEEGKPVPEVKPFPGSAWYVKHDEATAEAIRAALLPAEWGEEKGGLRMGLRLRQATVTAGRPVVAEVVIQNAGRKDWTLSQHRFNIYDYWPDTWFRVAAPDGSKWELRKPVGKITEADAPHPVTLKPGDAYTQAVRLDLWPAQANRADSSEPVPNLFTKSGEYVITAHFRHSPRPLATWTADFASPAVRLNVKKEGESDWGEAAGGLRARLRLAKAKFAAGEPLAFELDLKNTGDQTYEDGPIPMFCRIELDGAEYQYTAPLSYPTSIQKIPPGKEFVPYVKVATNEWWTHVFNDKSVPLALAPGTHKVRVGYPVAGKVTPYSPTVEFDVAAGEPTGKEVHGVRARLRPEREKWKAGESPRFALELANEGKRAWAGMPTDQRCVIEVDGAWYENESGLATPRREAEKVLKPGAGWTKWFDVYADRPRDGGVSWVVMLPDDPIRPAPDSQKLKLTPGRHKVRAAYFLTEYGADGRPRKSDAAEIRLETNAVEIEIEK